MGNFFISPTSPPYSSIVEKYKSVLVGLYFSNTAINDVKRKENLCAKSIENETVKQGQDSK